MATFKPKEQAIYLAANLDYATFKELSKKEALKFISMAYLKAIDKIGELKLDFDYKKFKTAVTILFKKMLESNEL